MNLPLQMPLSKVAGRDSQKKQLLAGRNSQKKRLLRISLPLQMPLSKEILKRNNFSLLEILKRNKFSKVSSIVVLNGELSGELSFENEGICPCR